MEKQEKLWKISITTEGMLLRTVIILDDKLLVLKHVVEKKKLDPSSLRSISVEPIPGSKKA